MRLVHSLGRHRNALFAAAVTVALQVEVWTAVRFVGNAVVSSVAALAFGAALLLRGRMPLVPLAVGATIIVAPHLNEHAN